MTNEQKNLLKNKIVEDIKTMQNEIECLKEKTQPISPERLMLLLESTHCVS